MVPMNTRPTISPPKAYGKIKNIWLSECGDYKTNTFKKNVFIVQNLKILEKTTPKLI